MAFNFKEAATSGLYALAGSMEGLRQHRNYVREEEKNQFAQRMEQERMALDRYRVETGVMQQADDLALREKEFIDMKAKWEASLEFERQKLKEQQRQYNENFPLEERKVGALEKTAESRETSAGASVTRAQAALDKVTTAKGAITPQGLLAEYGKHRRNAYNRIMEGHQQRFTKLTPEILEAADVEASNSAKQAIMEGIEAHNAFVYTGQNPGAKPIGASDIEAMYEDQEGIDDTSSTWELMRNDPDLLKKFDGGQLNQAELEALKANDPEMYTQYLKILERIRLRNKLEADRRKEEEKRRKERVRTTPERKPGPADFR